ncbi:MAG: acetate--CoA ligase family protein, partial [Candidatus Bathyarchaeia archaeon]
MIGASNKEGSVGFRLLNNLIGVGFRGFVYPVNPFRPSVQGITAYPSVRKIPWQIDLAIIATPAHVVPQILEECGESNIPGIIIVSSGFGETGGEGRLLEEQILKLRSTYKFRIMGPNCLGVMRPSIKLNATFANKAAKPGSIAFISQSGALCASVLDWAAQANVGFSYFVSVGSMIDVDFADLIDYFGIDPETRSIVLFIESIKDARKFMSAARRFAGTKPIVVVKAGRSPEGGRAAASHTGAITGEDAVYDAAFRRVGIVRVEEIADLFNCSEILAMQPTPRGPNLAIITNAGGPGVIATDALASKGGKLAPLSEETIQALGKVLPPYWSKSNPIDICDDATVKRFKEVLEICFKDPNIDGFLIIYAPIGAADPTETARALVKVSKNTDKPILTSWLGDEDVREARDILRRNGIPTCSTPEEAVSSFMCMYQYARNLELLYETPEELPISPLTDSRHLREVLEKAANEGREVLTEPESKEFLEAYGIPTAKAYTAKTAEEAVRIASEIGFPVVMKILSPEITYKTDFDGVFLNITSETQVKECFENLTRRVKEHAVPVEIEGVTVQPMIEKRGYELVIQSKKDPSFGSVIIFGAGGLGVELFNDISVGFPPLNQTLARRMMEQTKIYGYLLKGRGGRSANMRLLEEILVRFSQMIIDFPQVKEVDVDPLLIDEKNAVALDARIVIDLDRVFAEKPPYEHLV